MGRALKSSRLSLDRHTLLKWLCFLQKLYVLPLAGHSIVCGSCPPQLWHERVCCFPLSLWLFGPIFYLYPLGLCGCERCVVCRTLRQHSKLWKRF
jgi:hypothetical protein